MYRVLTQRHTQRLANLVVGKYGGKAKRRNPKSSILLRVGEIQKSNVKVKITINTEELWNAHTRLMGLVQPRNEQKYTRTN